MSIGHEKAAALEAVIGCGLFQAWHYLAAQWVIFAQAWNLLAIVFNKVKPDWTCHDDDGLWNYNNHTSLVTDAQKCAVKSNCSNLTYIYDYRSFVTEWDLVCEQDYVAYLLLTIQMTGVLTGSPLWGQLSDSFGRKWTLFATVLGIIVSGGLSAASPSWKVYAVLNFFVGFFCGGSISTSWVLWIELLSQKHRLWVPAVGGWPLAFVLLSLIAYLAKDWRIFLITINLLSIPALALILCIGESPRWLLGAGRIDEAVVGLKRIARINRYHIDQDQLNVITESKLPRRQSSVVSDAASEKRPPAPSSAGKKYTYWHLFSNKNTAVYTIVQSITFFCLSGVSFGLTFSLDKLAGSVYLNFTFLACLRWLGGLVTVAADIFIRKYGRRIGVIGPSLIISLSAGTVVVLLLVVPNYYGLPTVIRILLLCAAALCSPIWTGMGMSCNELFPTPIRSMAVAFCSIWNRLGAVVMPQILYLAKFWKPCPYLAFALLMFLCAVLFAVFIPETKGHPLPQQMPELKNKSKRSRRSGSGSGNGERTDSFSVYYHGANKPNIEPQTPLIIQQNAAV